MEKVNIIKLSETPKIIFKENHYQLFLCWKNSKKNKIAPPIVANIKTSVIDNSKTFQAILFVIKKFSGIRNIQDNSLKNRLIKILEKIYLGEKKYPDLEEISIDLVDVNGRRFDLNFSEIKNDMTDQELIDYLKFCLDNSDFNEDEFEKLDDIDLMYNDNELYDKDSEEDDLEGWSDFALTDGVWEETEKEDVINFIKKNYPDIELYETTDGTIFGGRYGQDSLEFKKDHLIIFRGNHILKYSDIKSGNDIKKFINIYLPY